MVCVALWPFRATVESYVGRGRSALPILSRLSLPAQYTTNPAAQNTPRVGGYPCLSRLGRLTCVQRAVMMSLLSAGISPAP